MRTKYARLYNIGIYPLKFYIIIRPSPITILFPWELLLSSIKSDVIDNTLLTIRVRGGEMCGQARGCHHWWIGVYRYLYIFNTFIAYTYSPLVSFYLRHLNAAAAPVIHYVRTRPGIFLRVCVMTSDVRTLS